MKTKIKTVLKFALSSGLAVPYFALLLLASGSASAQTIKWSNSGIHGAGFQNSLAIQPNGSDVVIVAGDVAGFHRSTDFGLNWVTSNRGVAAVSDGPPHLSSVVFDPSDADNVYAIAGWEYQKPGSYGFYVSTNGGRNWDRRSQAVQGLAGNSDPRLIGKLIAVDASGSDKFIYVASYDFGVKRSRNGGFNWDGMGFGNSPRRLRSIVVDPVTRTTVFLAADDGVWKCVNARTLNNTQPNNAGTSGWVRLDNGPAAPEELFMIGSNLYVVGRNAAGEGGIWKSENGGSSFSRLGLGEVPSASIWTAIAGYRRGSEDVLYIGCNNPVEAPGGNGFRTLLRSTDSGRSWAPITLNRNINYTLGNASGGTWWLSDEIQGNRTYMLNGSGYDTAQIAIDPVNRNRVLVAGRSGVWGSTNADEPNAANIQWYPRVRGLGVTVSRGVGVPSGDPNCVYVVDADYRFLVSKNNGATFERRIMGGRNGKAKGVCLAIDPLNDRAYVGLGSFSAVDIGEIWSNPNPVALTDPSDWTNEGFGAVLGGSEPKGMIVVRNGRGDRVIIVGVEGRGIWRKVGNGSWQPASSGGGSPNFNERTSFAWVPGLPYIYCYDQGTGVWRSTDAGDNWTRILVKASREVNTGHVVADPSQVGRIYISASDGVYRAVNAHTATTISSLTNLGGPDKPGPIALANGRLYACDLQGNPSSGARMFRWNSPASSASSTEISNGVYEAAAGWCEQLAVSPNGTIYASLEDNGVVVGRP